MVDATPLERRGRRLQWATIGWNVVEVFVTIGLGVASGSLALVAFGLDSLVEVFASLVVIWHMSPGERGHHAGRDDRALRLVAVAFGVLAAYLLIAGTRRLVVHQEQGSSVAGIVYLAVTAVVMFSLAHRKRRLGDALGSSPVRAEAAMTFLDGCLATATLTALALDLTVGWWWADPVAALLIGGVAASEARASWASTSPRSTATRRAASRRRR